MSSPTDPNDSSPRTERVDVGGGVELSVTVQGDGPTVLLVHGFPELGHSWRHQAPALAAAGYKVVVPDMRGYGASDRPARVEDYDIMRLTGDVVALIRHYGESATVVGHDWGAMVAWTLSTFRPDLVDGVVGVAIPYMPSIEKSILELIRDRVGEDGSHYMLSFQDPGVAEVELEADPYETMRRVLWLASADSAAFDGASLEDKTGFLDGDVPDGAPPWLSEADVRVYSDVFADTGFTGGLNWYRNLHRNWELLAPWRHCPVTVPAMFVGGRADPLLVNSGLLDENPPMLAIQAAYVADLRVELIDGAGHWIQQEKPAETTAAILSFLDQLPRT